MNKREAILDATLELISEHGFHGTSMAMIWKKAGVAAGTIYHYFDSKETLIRELYGELKSRMGKAMLAEDNPADKYKTRFIRFWTGLFHHFVGHPMEFQFLQLYSNSNFIDEETKQENVKFYKPVIDFLQQGIDQGVFKPVPVDLLVALVHGTVVSCVYLHLSGDLNMTTEYQQMAIDSCWYGLAEQKT